MIFAVFDVLLAVNMCINYSFFLYLSTTAADTRPKSVGLVCGSTAAWRCSTFTRWTGWTVEMTCVIWQHHKHCYRLGYYYYYCYYYYYYYYYYCCCCCFICHRWNSPLLSVSCSFCCCIDLQPRPVHSSSSMSWVHLLRLRRAVPLSFLLSYLQQWEWHTTDRQTDRQSSNFAASLNTFWCCTDCRHLQNAVSWHSVQHRLKTARCSCCAL